jgi:nucleoside-diphosphate-sugar epimerase
LADPNLNARRMPVAKTFLVTGAAGFIGFHVCRRLLHDGHAIVGVDNLSSYYRVELKKDRLAQLSAERFRFDQFDLVERSHTRIVYHIGNLPT